MISPQTTDSNLLFRSYLRLGYQEGASAPRLLSGSASASRRQLGAPPGVPGWGVRFQEGAASRPTTSTGAALTVALTADNTMQARVSTRILDGVLIGSWGGGPTDDYMLYSVGT